ncbi:MAG: hypothetical protein FWG67_02965 [Defluviitaleaceae bacterium]|nr:hypothetical protein [Defluviitaleaceae bacterium]
MTISGTRKTISTILTEHTLNNAENVAINPRSCVIFEEKQVPKAPEKSLEK